MWTERMTGKTVARLVAVVVLVAAAFATGAYVGRDVGLKRSAAAMENGAGQSDDTLQPIGVNFTPVWKAWHAINEKYVPASTTTAVSEEDKVWGLIEGLAASLDDPYTVFLPPEDASIFQDDISGSFEGVGMEIGIRDSILTVVAPLKDTPAYRAGVLAGDRIIEIDGESTDRLSIDRAVRKIRGPRGTEVVLTVAREGKDSFLTIPITRDRIDIPTIDTRIEEGGEGGTAGETPLGLRNGGVFVIQLHNFSAVSPGAFRDALRHFIESGTTKLILDLRGNPGGYLEAAVDMTSWFLPAGKTIVTEDFGENRTANIHRSRGYDVFDKNLNMVVLVNRGSASASEILAGALAEYGIATVIGENTFGKGSVQELIEITPETALKVTIARWVTPEGRSISESGLVPDIVVAMTPEDAAEGRDPQMDRAVLFLTTGN